MPYRDPTLDIPSTSVDWAIGGSPDLTWTAPSGSPDHIIVWRNTSPDWSTASNISGSLAGSATSYSDGTATTDATAFYYWAIAYNAAETYAGANYGVLAWQGTYLNANIGTYDSQTGAGLNEPFSPQVLADGDFFRSQASFTYSANQCVDGYSHPIGQPNTPNDDYVFMEVFQTDATFHVTNPIAGELNSSSWSTVMRVGTGGIGQSGPGGSGTLVPTNGGHTDPVYAIAPSTPNGYIEIAMVTEGTPQNWGNISGIVANVQVAFLSAGATVSSGVGGIGGGSGSPSGMTRMPLTVPTPTPLPAIPCCKTVAPICHCPNNGA